MKRIWAMHPFLRNPLPIVNANFISLRFGQGRTEAHSVASPLPPKRPLRRGDFGGNDCAGGLCALWAQSPPAQKQKKVSTKRICSLFLVCVLLLTALSGCTRGGGDDPGSLQYAADDVMMRLTGIPADTVLLTVDGVDVPADLFFYWLEYSLQAMDYVYYGGEGIDWEDRFGELSASDYALSDALETVRLYSVAESRANACGVGRDAALEAELASARLEYVDTMGGEEAFGEMLSSYNLRESSFFQILASSLLFERLLDLLYGAGGEYYPTAEDLDRYCTEQGVFQVKYLCFAQDEAGTALAQEALATLQKAVDPGAAMDDLIQTHSSAALAPAFSGGRLYTKGRTLAYKEQYGEYLFEEQAPARELYDAALALDEGEVSGIFSCGTEQLIVLRLPVTQAMLTDAYGADAFNRQLGIWAQESKVVYAPAFETVDVRAFYDNLRLLY